MTRAFLGAILALGSFLGAAFSSVALAYSVSYQAEISLWSQNSSEYLTPSTGPLTQASVSQSFHEVGESNDLLLFGTASIGRLSGTSYAQVQDAGDLSGTRGVEVMSFSDIITAIGAPGTMVNFLATLSMTSLVDFFGVGPCNNTFASAAASATVGGGSLEVGNYRGCQTAPGSPQTRAFQVLAGSSFPVSADLTVLADVVAGVHAEAFADATMIFNLDVRTPGASYLTESGVSYALLVPELDTLVLTAVGLVGLAARRRAMIKGRLSRPRGAPQVLHRA